MSLDASSDRESTALKHLRPFLAWVRQQHEAAETATLGCEGASAMPQLARHGRTTGSRRQTPACSGLTDDDDTAPLHSPPEGSAGIGAYCLPVWTPLIHQATGRGPHRLCLPWCRPPVCGRRGECLAPPTSREHHSACIQQGSRRQRLPILYQ
jgi:hypothetical protein